MGSERRLEANDLSLEREEMRQSIGPLEGLSSRFHGILDRYCQDIFLTMREVSRVLRPGGTVTFVIGNSCIRGAYIQNADAIAKAAKLLGLRQVSRRERELPSRRRYLPLPSSGALGKRIRSETILRFET